MLIYNANQTAAAENARSVEPIQPVSPASPASPALREPDPFGPAYVREKSASGREDFAAYNSDARMVNSLKERDREVRRNESAKGEAVGDENYIYQVGPDGKRYAIGTAAHAVEQKDDAAPAAPKGPDGKELSESDEALLQKLKERDAKVRNHEAAHVMAAGGQASSPTYTYQTGPDGRRYAIGGSVNISIMTTGDSEADARRAKNAYRAAMATGEPSGRDMQTANRAQSMAAKSMREVADRYAAVQDEIY